MEANGKMEKSCRHATQKLIKISDHWWASFVLPQSSGGGCSVGREIGPNMAEGVFNNGSMVLDVCLYGPLLNS